MTFGSQALLWWQRVREARAIQGRVSVWALDARPSTGGPGLPALAKAAFQIVLAIRALRGDGLPSSLRRLERLSCRRGVDDVAHADLEAWAWRFLLISRAIYGPQLCVHESLAIAAGMRSAGIDVRVAVGFERDPAPSRTPMHVWPTVADRPLLESPRTEAVYRLIATYPASPAT